MKGSEFVRMIEEEYALLASTIPESELHGRRRTEIFPFPSREEKVTRFKEWFRIALQSTSMNTSEVNIKPEEVILLAASTSFETEPKEPVYASLVKALSLYDNDELEDLFGYKMAAELLKIFRKYGLSGMYSV